MANRFHNPRPQFMNATPVVYNAGILRFYASGTSTPMNVYSGSDLTGASTTITLNSAGRPSQDIFLSTALYKVTLEDSLGNPIWTVDPYMTSDYTTVAKVQGYSGNPNGFVAGTASAGAVPADMVWDRSNHVLYLCTVTGVAAAAVWTVANVTALQTWTTAGRNVSPTAGVDFGYNTTLASLEYWNAANWISLGKAPTVQTKLSGSAATYTATAGTVRQRVRMSAGGGGGAAATVNAGAVGIDSSFQVNATGTAWTVVHGNGGVASAGAPGAGGTGGTDGSTGTLIARFAGGRGQGSGGSATVNVFFPGGAGGSNPFGGAGGGSSNPTAGQNAATNTGGGGGGGSSASAGAAGTGGGAGEYVEFWVTGMTTALYTVGGGGNGGTAGTFAGGNGAAGIIIIEEFYS